MKNVIEELLTCSVFSPQPTAPCSSEIRETRRKKLEEEGTAGGIREEEGRLVQREAVEHHGHEERLLCPVVLQVLIVVYQLPAHLLYRGLQALQGRLVRELFWKQQLRLKGLAGVRL